MSAMRLSLGRGGRDLFLLVLVSLVLLSQLHLLSLLPGSAWPPSFSVRHIKTAASSSSNGGTDGDDDGGDAESASSGFFSFFGRGPDDDSDLDDRLSSSRSRSVEQRISAIERQSKLRAERAKGMRQRALAEYQQKQMAGQVLTQAVHVPRAGGAGAGAGGVPPWAPGPAPPPAPAAAASSSSLSISTSLSSSEMSALQQSLNASFPFMPSTSSTSVFDPASFNPASIRSREDIPFATMDIRAYRQLPFVAYQPLPFPLPLPPAPPSSAASWSQPQGKAGSTKIDTCPQWFGNGYSDRLDVCRPPIPLSGGGGGGPGGGAQQPDADSVARAIRAGRISQVQKKKKASPFISG